MLSSLRRVLRPDAALIAVTNAAAYTAELDEIFAEATTALFGEERPRPRLPAKGFTIDEAASHLSRHFASVTIHVRRVPLKVPTPEPVVAYLASLRSYIDEALASTARLFDELAPYIEAAALRRITATGASRSRVFRRPSSAGGPRAFRTNVGAGSPDVADRRLEAVRCIRSRRLAKQSTPGVLRMK